MKCNDVSRKARKLLIFRRIAPRFIAPMRAVCHPYGDDVLKISSSRKRLVCLHFQASQEAEDLPKVAAAVQQNLHAEMYWSLSFAAAYLFS